MLLHYFLLTFLAYLDIQRVAKMIPLINSLEALSAAKDSQYIYGVVSNKVWLWFHKGRNIRIARVLINLCQNQEWNLSISISSPIIKQCLSF